MRYIGITGFTSRAEVDACLEALPLGATLMCGVLVSEKTLRGEPNKWWRRYPRVEEIADIFSDDPWCLNLIHYCDDVPPSASLVRQLHEIGGYDCHGFQFNGAWPVPAAMPDDGTVVFQFRPDKDELEGLLEAVKFASHLDARVLVDASGGRGEPMDVEAVDHWACLIGGYVGYDRVGIAGGLCTETLPAVATLLREEPFSIDAEGRLRDGDEGGTLNLDKARAYLRAAVEIGARS